MYVLDQKYRNQLGDLINTYGYDSPEVKTLFQLQGRIDSSNVARLQQIFDEVAHQFGAPAAGQSQKGPTSSTSVSISASVAAKYGLGVNGAAIRSLESGAGGFCMTTNGRPTDLPVKLVRHQFEEMAAARMPEERASQLSWCAIGKWAVDAIRSGEPGDGNTLLIIRPE